MSINSQTAAAHVRSAGWSPQVLPLAILVGGCLNGFAARIIEGWPAGGLPSLPWLGLSPIELFAAFVAANALTNAASDADWPRAGLIEAVVLAIILLPSSTLAWLATGAYAAYGCFCFPRSARAGAGLFLGLALASLWSATLLAWYTPEITTVEARAVAALLSIVRDDIVQSGNIVGQPGGHTLVILTACSAFDALPRALLGVLAVAAFMGSIDTRRCMIACAAATIMVFVGNQIRLSLMTWSAPAYEAVHGSVGANVYDLLQVVLVLALGLIASRS